jgi:hypothetical protein
MANKDRKPPYISGWILDQFFKKVRTVNIPDKLTVMTLKGWGVAENQEHPLLSALRFLGLIDDDGTPLPNFRKTQVEGEEFKSNLKQIIEESYPDLFKELKVDQASYQDFLNFFGVHYSQASKSKMVKAFGHLCNSAGLEYPAFEKIRRRRKTPEIERERKTAVAKPTQLHVTAPKTKTLSNEAAIGHEDRVVRLAQIMAQAGWNAEQMKVFIDNIDKMEGKKTDEKKENNN